MKLALDPSPIGRKRIGQFFSGSKLGRLLAALADAPACRHIVDPMAGSGDLLKGCLDVGAHPTLIAGIEIDAVAHSEARRRLPSARIVKGNAFDATVVRDLGRDAFDLVITNPPFVRYQDMAEARLDVPSAGAVRRELIHTLTQLRETQTFEPDIGIIEAAKGYSGFADLALPSCLLCMALTSPGGRLALVLPQTWLARDYAEPMRSCLEKSFDLEMVVDDEGAAWFPDASVRTTLVVARRRGAADKPSGSYARVTLRPTTADASSLVGPARHDDKTGPEVRFARTVRAIASGRRQPIACAANVEVVIGGRPAYRAADPAGRGADDEMTLSALGVSIGQGLRTGANEFFYVKSIDDGAAFVTSRQFGTRTIANDDGVLRPAIRDQRGSARSGDMAILDLRAVALPEDVAKMVVPSPYRPMSAALAAHVRSAGAIPGGKPGRETPIKELSAVRTNVRLGGRERPPRFWYMLPDFTERHEPDVFLPRVCGDRPTPAVVPARGILVDANFITFRCKGPLTPQALLAVLDSTRVWHWLETTGAVMGGGALKIESTMLARLPLPTMDAEQLADLHAVGSAAMGADRRKLQSHADEIMSRGSMQDADTVGRLRDAASSRLAQRQRRHRIVEGVS